jgi:hypothetical protein
MRPSKTSIAPIMIISQPAKLTQPVHFALVLAPAYVLVLASTALLLSR